MDMFQGVSIADAISAMHQQPRRHRFCEEILNRGPQIRCERSDCKLHPASLPHHVLSVRAMQLQAPT